MSGCSVTQGDAEPALTEVASVAAWPVCECNRVWAAQRLAVPAPGSPQWGSIRC